MNALVSMCFGAMNGMRPISYPLLQYYAKRIGAEFISIDERMAGVAPNLSKFYIHDLLGKYDRIIYMDCDLLVKPNCPNLFDIVPRNRPGIFNEGAAVSRKELIKRIDFISGYARIFGWNLPTSLDAPTFYNAGVMVLSKEHRHLYEFPPVMDSRIWSDQACLNLRLIMHKEKVYHLPESFNQMRMNIHVPPEPIVTSFVLHFAGKLDEETAEKKQVAMASGLMMWRNDFPEFPWDQIYTG